MALVLKNSAVSRLASSLSSSETAITVTGGEGARFPALGAGDWFPLTIISDSGSIEVVRCTARASDILTVVRAQEGTLAGTFSAGARVELRLTKAALDEFLKQDHIQSSPMDAQAGKLMTVGAFGLGDAGILEPISGTAAQAITTPSGLYRVLGSDVGSPGGYSAEGFLLHQTNGSGIAAQEFVSASNPVRIHRRAYSSGAWSAWVEICHEANLAGMSSLIKNLSSYTLNAAAATTALDLSSTQVFRIDASVNRTLTFSNPPGAGRAMAVVITLSGNKVITWPAGIRWNGGVAPALSPTWTVVTLVWDGSVWSGSVGGRG